MGLFERRTLTTLALPPSLEPLCGKCGLYKTCNSPKMKWSGEGRKKILILAEAPGETEDRLGKQLVGNSGQELSRVLARHGVDMRRDCWLDSSLMCRPKGNQIPDNVTWIDDCRPHVIRTVTELKPEVIILLGGKACESLLGWLWKEDVGSAHRWAGYRIPHRKLNCWICPTFHPSYLLHSKDQVLERMFDSHLKAACSLKGPPYKTVPPDDRDVCRNILNVDKAAKYLDFMGKWGTGFTIAFDYETTTLKPDGPHAEIFACSVAATDPVKRKEFAFAFPWQGPVIPAMRQLLRNPKIKKVGSNIQFEERWTVKFLKTRVKGWWSGKADSADTMLAAHALENGSKTRRITGIKFQAFAHLGIDEWDSHVKPYLQSGEKSGNAPNRIRECDLQDLLLYCALDSLYELQVHYKQQKLLLEE